ncbi:hypothetical protein [Sinorhizobium meliloti]|uniref:hypothetical protein n=1 Tax=Rhizobium meliloti TaxID=382 RepID=UPI001912A6E8|nr:hypothetical protein [Sinorhizobium meliloti]
MSSRVEMETPAGMTRTCCREAEGRGLSRLHVDTTALTMPAISTAISRCAGRCKRLLVRPDVSGSFGDIVIVFVDNDLAALAVAKACPPALDIRNFQGDPIGLRRLGCEREKRQMRQAIIRVTDGDHDAVRSGLPAFGFAVLVLPRPEIGISNHLTGQELTTHRHTSRPRQPVDLRGEELPMLLRHLGSAMDAARSPPVRIRS